MNPELPEVTLPTPPDQRLILTEWANPWRRVIYIDIDPKDRQVTILTGKIMDPAGFEMDPRKKIMVWFDQVINSMADDAHSRVFDIDDRHVLWATEAHFLIDPRACLKWFGEEYPLSIAGNYELLEKIKKALLESPYEPTPGVRM